MPRVSVIMNSYNSESHLADTLTSLAAQSFQDFEVIFWDNASTDASPQIARSFGPQLRYFRAESTSPLGQARNLALAQTQGDVFAFLDCDDLWLPDKLERQMALFDANPRLGLACTDTVMFSERGDLSRVFAKSAPARGHVFRELVERQWISMSSAMISRSAFEGLAEGFDPTLLVCEEADVFYRLALRYDLDYVDAPLTRWRVHGVNTTFRKFGIVADETLRILGKLRRMNPDFDTEYPGLAAQMERRSAFQRAVSQWREGHGSAARATIHPYLDSPKSRLFWLASWLPGSCFDPLARMYFALPASIRR